MAKLSIYYSDGQLRHEVELTSRSDCRSVANEKSFSGWLGSWTRLENGDDMTKDYTNDQTFVISEGK
jgi:hypothetical protein